MMLQTLSLLLATFGVANSHSGKNSSRNGTQDVIITVNPSHEFQAFDGMGFSEAFQRGKQIYGADGLSPENTTRVLDLLFSNDVGAGFTILRNGIGSSPKDPYDLMLSIEPVSPGTSNGTPSYRWDGNDNGQVRLSRDAMARGVQTIYADAWSAPGFMKNNSDDSYGGYLCGVTAIDCSTGDWRQAYANYLVQYLRFYEQSGIPVAHVGFLNEPDLNVSYASMLSDGRQAADFLKVFYPILKASGLNTTIACCDGSGWEEARERIAGIQDAGAEYTLDIASAHGYSSPLSTPFNTSARVWQSEWADLDGPRTFDWYYNGSTGEGLTWANNIQHAFAVSNVSAFLYWEGADNTTGNSALIILDGDTVQVSKRLWAHAQFSRFVKPGAVRIQASVDHAAVNSTAFKNADGSLAIQIINNNDSLETAKIVGIYSEDTLVKSYLTSNDHDLVAVDVRAGHGTFGVSIPARSMLSVVVSHR